MLHNLRSMRNRVCYSSKCVYDVVANRHDGAARWWNVFWTLFSAKSAMSGHSPTNSEDALIYLQVGVASLKF